MTVSQLICILETCSDQAIVKFDSGSCGDLYDILQVTSKEVFNINDDLDPDVNSSLYVILE